MSYEPTLVILKKDLEKHQDLIVDGDWQYKINDKEDKGEEGLTVMEYLRDLYVKDKSVKVGGVELLLCTPTFSTFNRKVREKLHELDVEFAEKN